MADSFADLWSTTAPASSSANNNTKNKPLSSLSASQNAPSISPQAAYANKRTTSDLFSMLASPSHSSSNSRSVSPSPPQPRQRVSPKPPSTASNGDAFSSLLASASSSSSVNLDKMTIAQRTAYAAANNTNNRHSPAPNTTSTASSAWEGLDALGSSTSSFSPSATSMKGATTTDDLFDFAPIIPTTSATNRPSLSSTPSFTLSHDHNDNSNDDWGLSDFASPNNLPSSSHATKSAASATTTQKPKPSSSNSGGGSIWDSDDFVVAASSRSRNHSPDNGLDPDSRQDSTNPSAASRGGEYDNEDDEWGVKRGIGARNYEAEDDDDILGDLGKPVDHEAIKRKQAEQAEAESRAQREKNASRNAPSSPPPHVLGSLVSMGFSVHQAKAALAEANGNPEAAVEILVNASGSTSRNNTPPPSRPNLPRRPSSQRQQQQQQQQQPGSSSSTTPSSLDGVINTDKLISQATVIGTNLFNRAGAMWKQGKEQVQKAYDEMSNQNTPALDGRPKWMREVEEGPDAAINRSRSNKAANGGGFKDEDGMGPSPVEHPSSKAHKPPKGKSARVEAEPEVDLFSSSNARRFVSNDEDHVNVYRRKRPAAPSSSRSNTDSTRQRAVQPQQQPRQVPPHPCTQVSISSSQISSGQQHISRAENAIKLGQYSVAAEAYTAALDALPSGHVKCLSVLLGRGEARMKDGDSKGAFEDAQGMLAILIPSSSTSLSSSSSIFNPGDWAKPAVGTGTKQEDLGKMYVGALKLRAQSSEAKEKWRDAMGDWEKISGLSFASSDLRGEASRGRARCKGVLEPKPKQESSSSGLGRKPGPSAAAASVYKPKVQISGEAVKELRKANKAQENEDDEKFKLKDGVDAKLLAWKGGKENNIRALLGSLDMVLWPELGLKKIGMHELVQEKQVKLCYMKAVGRVHPDKINPSNSTLEQRMIANAVFGALNEAWNSHKG